MGDNHSLSDKVFHKLQEDILSGKYAVDEELKEKPIGDELGVSRTPVREALRQLELQGLVTITPNKGAHVTGFSKEDLNDIYEIRSVMEGLCAKWAAKKATPEQLREYLGEVLPNFDRERVYVADIKKLISWYNILISNGITEFKSEPEAEEEVATDEK